MFRGSRCVIIIWRFLFLPWPESSYVNSLVFIDSINFSSSKYTDEKGKRSSTTGHSHYFRCVTLQELQDTAADVIGVDKYHQVRDYNSKQEMMINGVRLCGSNESFHGYL